jgi:hypothetical protein
MNKFDTAAALAWVKERFLVRCFAVTYPACIQVIETLLSFVVSWVIHYIGTLGEVRMVAEVTVRVLHSGIRLKSTVKLNQIFTMLLG